MKKTLLLFSMLLALVGVNAAATQLFGTSIINDGTAGVWADYWDYAQCGEYLGKFQKPTVMLGLGNQWGSYTRFGYATPNMVFLGSFNVNGTYNKSWYDTDPINHFASTNSYTNSSSTGSSYYGLGWGTRFNNIGIIIDAQFNDSSSIDHFIYQNIYKTNTTISNRTLGNYAYDIANYDNAILVAEIALDNGAIQPQLNLRYEMNNGWKNSDRAYNAYTNYVAANDRRNNALIEYDSGYFPNVYALSSFYPSYLQSGLLAAEFEYKNNEFFGGSLRVAPSVSMRMIGKDYAYLTSTTNYDWDQTVEENYLLTKDFTSTKTTIDKASDLTAALAVKWKKTWNVLNNLNLGIYPSLSFSGRMFNVAIKTVEYDRAYGYTTAGDVSSDTQTVYSGDNDSVKYQSFSGTLGIPLGAKWRVSKVVELFFAGTFALQYSYTSRYVEDTTGYLAQVDTDNYAGTDPVTTAINNSVNKTKTISQGITLSKSLVFGSSLYINDNFRVDLLATTTGTITTTTFNAGVVYLLSPPEPAPAAAAPAATPAAPAPAQPAPARGGR